MTELVLPQHANALGTIFGGVVMSWIDVCAAVTAQRHTGRVVVTVMIDDLVFRAPMRVGDIARIVGRVNAAFRTSLEVEVRVERETRSTAARELCVDALCTFVALDDEGKPTAVPPLLCETDDDRKREHAATDRRTTRLGKKL